MTKDYVKYKYKRQRQTNKTVVWVLIAMALMIGASFGLYARYKPSFNVASAKSEMLLKVSSYFPSFFVKGKAQPGTKKLVAAAAETVKPIHFDFYDELPKVQLEYSQKQVQEEEDNSAEAPEAKSLAQQKNIPSSIEPPAKAVDEKNIEQELYADLSSIKASESSPYILLIGVFHNMEAASRYRLALVSAGLKVDIVKAHVGKELVYRLQQGPYYNQEQLKSAKKRLSERGITCDIYKVPPYES